MQRMELRDRGHFGHALMVALMMVMAGAGSADAQQDAGTGASRGVDAENRMPADVVAAHTFLFAAYPELMERDLTMTLRRDGGAILVSVVDASADIPALPDPGRAAPAPTPSPSGERTPDDAPQTRRPVLTARLQFDTQTRLRRYDAYGSLVHEAEQLALQEQLLANPRWLDSDIDAWLIARGVATTMGTSAPAAVVTTTHAVEEQIGASRRPVAIRFRWYTDEGLDAGARTFRSRPAWVSEALAAGGDGQAILYQFEYEPFGGRLISVTSQEAR